MGMREAEESGSEESAPEESHPMTRTATVRRAERKRVEKESILIGGRVRNACRILSIGQCSHW
jgi:hypothetical protein